MKRLKRIITLAVMACLMISSTAFAVPRHVNVNNAKKSAILIIGDSRVVQMSQYCKGASFNATWGGHYKDQQEWDDDCGLGIGSKKKIKEMKEIVKDSLKKHGKCYVVLSSTDNDATKKGSKASGKESAEGMKEVRDALAKVKVNGKTATFYFASSIGDKGETKQVDALNKQIKKKFGTSNWIDVGTESQWKKYYGDDDAHFTKKGVQKHFNKIIGTLPK